MFKGWLLNKTDAGTEATLTDLSEDQLPDGDVTVSVTHSTLNYKDGLAFTGRSPVVRTWPMVPGIDFAGQVIESNAERFKVGDAVLLNGWGVGEVHWGGLAQKAKVKSDWLIHQPDGLSGLQCMALGTAGYTAMLCVMALENWGLTPDQGPILVTGAAGGVGSVAVAILSQLGFDVWASTGRAGEAEYLKGLGACEIVDRSTLSEPGRPLGKERWAGAVDAVGSHTLANVLAQTKYGGAVAACGLAQGMDLPATVMPFILRGVGLLGVDSVMCPLHKRQAAWSRLAQDVDVGFLTDVMTHIPLQDAYDSAQDLLDGGVRGRVVVSVQ